MNGLRLILGLLCTVSLCARAQMPEMPPAPIESFVVKPQAINHGVVSTGELRASRSVVIKSEIPGHVMKLNLPEGKVVEAGTLLIALDNHAAEATLNQSKAKHEYSKLKFDRLQILAKKGIGSVNEKDEALANMKFEEASVALAKAQLEKTQLTAPFSGTLGLRQVNVGDYVDPGQPLINLEDTSTLLVDFRIPEKHLSQLKAGQSVEVIPEAIPSQKFSGKVFAISPQIDSVTRTLSARASLANVNGVLTPGLFTKIKVIFDQNNQALLVPEQAVFMVKDKHFVYRINQQKAKLTEVKTGVREAGMVEIVSGLSPKDVIAKSGHMRLYDGAPILIAQHEK